MFRNERGQGRREGYLSDIPVKYGGLLGQRSVRGCGIPGDST